MSDRHTVDTITSDALDALYDRVAELEAETAKLIRWHREDGTAFTKAQRRIEQLTAGRATWKAKALEMEQCAEQAEAAIDATYRERAHLVAHLAALHPSHIGHTDPNAPDWAVVIIETPAGQMSWHIAPRDMDLFAHVQPTNRICRGWDGHTTDEKYQRMRDLTEATPSLLSQDTMIEVQGRHLAALKTAHVALASQAGKDQAAIERVRAWIAGEPVTARSEFGSGYREALRDITDALDQPQQPTLPGDHRTCCTARIGHHPTCRTNQPQQPTTTEAAVPCSLAVLKRPHEAHTWEPQPGMNPVHCPGPEQQLTAPAFPCSARVPDPDSETPLRTCHLPAGHQGWHHDAQHQDRWLPNSPAIEQPTL